MIFYLILFLFSFLLLIWAGSFLVEALLKVARFLRWKEFVIAFFMIAFASTVPNFFVGISSAFHKVPQISFGEVLGGNLIDLTLAVAVAVFFAKSLPTKSPLVQKSCTFTFLIALLPLLLILDGTLSRGDGLILIFVFFVYLFWVFGKKQRYQNFYLQREIPKEGGFFDFLKNFFKTILGICFLLIGAEGIVRSILGIVETQKIELPLISILVVGFGNALPETYFALIAAKRKQTQMILGDLIGSVISPSTLVLGTVSLLSPIVIEDFSPFFLPRLFLILAICFFLFFAKTGREITQKEGVFLLSLYFLFVFLEIILR